MVSLQPPDIGVAKPGRRTPAQALQRAVLGREMTVQAHRQTPEGGELGTRDMDALGQDLVFHITDFTIQTRGHAAEPVGLTLE